MTISAPHVLPRVGDVWYFETLQGEYSVGSAYVRIVSLREHLVDFKVLSLSPDPKTLPEEEQFFTRVMNGYLREYPLEFMLNPGRSSVRWRQVAHIHTCEYCHHHPPEPNDYICISCKGAT